MSTQFKKILQHLSAYHNHIVFDEHPSQCHKTSLLTKVFNERPKTLLPFACVHVEAIGSCKPDR